MFVSDNLNVNEKGHLTIGSVDTVDLAGEFKTPLYVMDEGLIRENCRLFKQAIEDNYNGNGLVLFASKAFSSIYMCKIVKQEGLGLDVVSGGELYTALKADFPMDKVYFHGNNKTADELIMAVENSVGRIVVDNIFELHALNDIAKKMSKIVDILFRIKPGIDAHTHDFIRTGQIDSKFGFAIETGEALQAVKEAVGLKNINLVGIHCHIGSQIFDIDPFELATKVMLEFAAKIKGEFGIEMDEINLGGGYGIQYLPSDDPVGYSSYIGKIADIIIPMCEELGLKLPKILMEPGRAIVGPAGITLYRVGAVKQIPGIRKYVSVDGGMTDNPRYILYQSKYHALLANKANEEPVEAVTVAGKCCESGDILMKDALMPKINVGDTLAVLATGAYNYSMSSNYNRILKPAVVIIKDKKAKVIVKRETYEDIIRNDIIDQD